MADLTPKQNTKTAQPGNYTALISLLAEMIRIYRETGKVKATR